MIETAIFKARGETWLFQAAAPLAHCAECSLWLRPDQSCLHIGHNRLCQNPEAHGHPISTPGTDSLLRVADRDRSLGSISSRLIEAHAHIFTVDPATGDIKRDGRIVGFRYSRGYIRIKIKDHGVLAHRLAWFLYYGEQACGEIDHINGDRTDNRKCNLRLATAAQNKWNRAKSSGSSIFKGVSRDWNKWAARIRTGGGRTKYLGSFASERDAAEAYDSAAREHFGDFAALNFPVEGERSALQTPDGVDPLPASVRQTARREIAVPKADPSACLFFNPHASEIANV